MKYKYKFTPTLWVLFVLGYILCVACFVWNLVRLVGSFGTDIQLNPMNTAAMILCLALSPLFAVFITSVILRSYYRVDKQKLTVRFGLTKDVFPVHDVDKIVRNVRTDKLQIIFKDQSTYSVVVDPKYFDDFSKELMDANRSIEYGESDEPDQSAKGKN